MFTLSQHPFFKTYKRISETKQIKIKESTIRYNYSLFIENLYDFLNRAESVMSSLRILFLIKIDFISFQKNIQQNIPNAPSTILELIDRTISIIDAEIKLLYLRIKNPSIDKDIAVGTLRSGKQLYWSKKNGKAKLIELILSLYADEALCYSDQTPASYSDIVEIIEENWHVNLKNYGVLKHTVLNRINTAPYMDNLKRKLIEFSQR